MAEQGTKTIAQNKVEIYKGGELIYSEYISEIDSIKFKRSIKIGEEITFYTWPLAPKHFTADRDYKAVDKKGNVVFVGTSVWNLIDLTKRSLTSTEIVKDIRVDYKTDRAIQDASYSRFRLSPDFVLNYSKTIRISEIDINNHVNNTNYFSYSQDVLSSQEYDKGIKELEIRFNQLISFNFKTPVKLFMQVISLINLFFPIPNSCAKTTFSGTQIFNQRKRRIIINRFNL